MALTKKLAQEIATLINAYDVAVTLRDKALCSMRMELPKNEWDKHSDSYTYWDARAKVIRQQFRDIGIPLER